MITLKKFSGLFLLVPILLEHTSHPFLSRLLYPYTALLFPGLPSPCPLPEQWIVHDVNFNQLTGSLSRNVFERRTSTGSEALSLLICCNASKFVSLSTFSLMKTIWPKEVGITTAPKKNKNRPLLVDVSRLKTS